MTTRMSDLVMTKDEDGDDGEGEHKDQGDAEKNHKHLPKIRSGLKTQFFLPIMYFFTHFYPNQSMSLCYGADNIKGRP